jgi:hypothetical protein
LKDNKNEGDTVLLELTKLFSCKACFMFTKPPLNKVVFVADREPIFRGEIVGGSQGYRNTYFVASIISNASNVYALQQLPLITRGKILQFAPSAKFSSPEDMALQFIQYYYIVGIQLKDKDEIYIDYTDVENNKTKTSSLLIENKFQANLFDKSLKTPLTVAIQCVQLL